MTFIETIDAFHRGAFHLVQPKGRGHRAGMDAMMLASLVDAEGPVRVADLGAGAGAAGLAGHKGAEHGERERRSAEAAGMAHGIVLR